MKKHLLLLAFLLSFIGLASTVNLSAAPPPPATSQTVLNWRNVKNYGAKGNGRLVHDGAMTSGSATLTSATAAFVAADVGKKIEIAGAGAAGIPLSGTINARNSSTSVTLSVTASTTVSSKMVHFGTDDTTAIQNAINAAGTAGGGTVYFPSGIYIIGGALQANHNSQLYFPAKADNGVTGASAVTVKLLGEATYPPFSGPGSTPWMTKCGVILKSTLTAGNGAVLGGGYTTGNYLNMSWLLASIENIAVRTVNNPTNSAIDLTYVQTCDLTNVSTDTGAFADLSITQPTTTTSYGIKGLQNNNGAWNVTNRCTAIGFYTGFYFTEHATGSNNNAWACKYAFEFGAANHASYFGRLMAVDCQNTLRFTGGRHDTAIMELNVEHYSGGLWMALVYDVDDASNYARGRVYWHVVTGGVGVDTVFNKNGASNLFTQQLGTFPLTVSESDGSPLVKGVTNLVVSNGALTDNGSGSVTLTTASSTAPSFSSGEIGAVNATTLVATFSQNVKAPSSDYSSGVTIKVNGATASITSATRQTDNTKVHYVIGTTVVAGDFITWEYASKNGFIQNYSGVNLGDVSAQTITNTLGTFTPTDIGSIVLWVDFSDVSTLYQDSGRTTAITTDGQTIQGITDKSGAGHHLSQATTSKGFLYKTNQKNGRSVARTQFANSSYLRATWTQAQPVTVFVVVKNTSNHLAGDTWVDGSATNVVRVFIGGSNPGQTAINAGGTTLVDGVVNISNGDWVLSESKFNGASSSVAHNGGTAATGNPGTASPGGVVLGINGNLTNSPMDGDIAEVIMYNAALTSGEMTSVRNYLNGKWAIY